MSQILKGFVGALNHPRGHLPDLEVLGVTTDGHTPGVGWEELPSPTFPGGPDGERVFAAGLSSPGLSRLGFGWDEKARVLYLGVVFGKDDLVAPPGQAARTKSLLRRGLIYGEVAISPDGEFTVVRDFGPMGNLLLAIEKTELEAYLIGQFNDWQIRSESMIVLRTQNYWEMAAQEPPVWTVAQKIPEETLAKIAIPMPPDWRVVWNSGHHRPGIVQELRLWPAVR